MILTECTKSITVKNVSFNGLMESIYDFNINSESAWYDLHMKMARLEHSCIVNEEEGRLKKAAKSFWAAIKAWFKKAKDFVMNLLKKMKVFFMKLFAGNKSLFARAIAAKNVNAFSVKVKAPAYVEGDHNVAVTSIKSLVGTCNTLIDRMKGFSTRADMMGGGEAPAVRLSNGEKLEAYLNDQEGASKTKDDIYKFLGYDNSEGEITVDAAKARKVVMDAMKENHNKTIELLGAAEKSNRAIFESGEKMAAVFEAKGLDNKVAQTYGNRCKKLGLIFQDSMSVLAQVSKAKESFARNCASLILKNAGGAAAAAEEETKSESVNFSDIISSDSLLYNA